jgi:putative transposase
MNQQYITIKLRLRDRHFTELNRQARAVNLVWNYCNATQRKAVNDRRYWLSNFDLQRLTAGSSKELDIHAHTIKEICDSYHRSRKQFKKPWLKWRGQRSLGWIPFKAGHVIFDGGVFKFRNVKYQVMHIRDDLKSGIRIGAGSFNQDSRGRWYLNVLINVECATSAPLSYVGIDLGLKNLATLSVGDKIEAKGFYRASEVKLAISQRSKKSKRTNAIHAKVKNRRKDFLHKASAKLAKEFGLIVIGDVSPSRLAKTKMAKSVLDAGWANFKRMLTYKSIRNGGSMLEVSEAWTTQMCSVCGSRPPSRPIGIAHLGIREWTCDYCGTVHDRDVNAARNILRIGLDTLVEGAA